MKDLRAYVGEWGFRGGYNKLLDSFGYEIVLKIDDADYRGDSRVLFKNGNRYGILFFGWGSCSGCDALRGCESLKEVEALRQRLSNKIHWDSASALLKYVEEKDWALEWSWHSTETRGFIDKVKNILSNT